MKQTLHSAHYLQCNVRLHDRRRFRTCYKTVICTDFLHLLCSVGVQCLQKCFRLIAQTSVAVTVLKSNIRQKLSHLQFKAKESSPAASDESTGPSQQSEAAADDQSATQQQQASASDQLPEGSSEEPPPDVSEDPLPEELQPFEAAFHELRKWADTSEAKYWMVSAERERLSGRYATAVK